MTETIQETTEQADNVSITDGQTDNLPPIQPLTMETPTQTANLTNQTTTILGSGLSDPNFYTKDEFFEQFKSVFQFGGDTLNLESLPIKPNEEAGARITSNRIYEMAEKYKFLRFMIDKRSTRLGETILMIQFITSKAGAIYYEKRNQKLGGVLWQKAKKLFKRKESVYSVHQAAEKQLSQEKLSETAAAS